MSNDTEPVLTAERVESLHRGCLAPDGGDGITVEGIVRKARYSPAAIDLYRAEIRDLLAGLPDEFRTSGGGGWSFLNACNDRDGRLWTGLHVVMEELFMLGIAAGLVKELLGRDMWDALPGGMPYYAVDL
jgi:hypothetical protein